MKPKHPLKALNVSSIDLEDAQRHFDLPIEDQFSSKADLRRGLFATKAQLLHMFGQDASVTVYRGMSVPLDYLDNLEFGLPVGKCWAWEVDGALKGSGLDSGRVAADEIGIILVATTQRENINWEFTVAVNTFHEDEKEIVMAEDAPLLLHKALLVESGRATRDLLQDRHRDLEVTSCDIALYVSKIRP